MVNIDWKPKCIESNANIHRCEITRLTTPRHYSQLALGSIRARHHWRPSTNHHHRPFPLHFALYCRPGASGLLCFSTIGQDWSGSLYLSSRWRSDHRLWRLPVSPSLRPRQKLLLLETGCANKATSSRLLLDSTDLHVGSWCTTRHDFRKVTVFWGGCFEIHSLDTISKDFCSTHLLHSFLATWSRVPPWDWDALFAELIRKVVLCNAPLGFLSCRFFHQWGDQTSNVQTQTSFFEVLLNLWTW